MASSERPRRLASKKALILHNYALFLDRQTRLYTLSTSNGWCDSFEIEQKQRILLLDDLTIFAIAGRRLIDLCGLQSACNKAKIDHLGVESSYQPIRTFSIEGRSMGFYTLLNRIVHMSFFEYFGSRAMLAYELRRTIVDEMEFLRVMEERKEEKDRMDGVIFLKEERNPPVLLSLKGIIDASIVATDKIVEVCADEQIYLEAIFDS